MKISPIDFYVREGFAKQMAEQFQCNAAFVSSPDKLRNLQTLQGNAQPSYPYIFIEELSVADVGGVYSSHRLVRQGIPVSLNSDNNQFQMARIIPADFEFQVSFITNQRSSDDLNSVTGFTRRWLFARRNGSLQFNVNYGMSSVSIAYTLANSVPIQSREDPASQESYYTVTAIATVHGYVSEPELGTRGRIQQIQLAAVHPSDAGSQLFKF